jgi:bacterioferritin
MAKNVRDEKRARVVEAINKARSMELHAISQYMNQHYNLADMDYGDLAAKIKLIAIDEMRHAEMFAERIKELDGEPTTDLARKVERGQEIEVVFPSDAVLEDNTMIEYNQFAQTCREAGDSTSMKLFETIIDEEQIHFNYFDNIADHIKKLGPVYLAQVAGTPADAGPPSKGFIMGQAGQ